MSTVLYDINKTFIENWRIGPKLPPPLPIRQYPDHTKWHDWLGFKIMSRIGISACPIMNAKGIAIMSQLGFDVFTYKTIRSSAFHGHPWPNIKFINIQDQLTINDLSKIFYATQQYPTSTKQIAITNSFGNCSLSPEIVIQDIADAKKVLRKGQILIASIYGEKTEYRSQSADYVFTAKLAQEAGADIIEANISCPNLQLSNQKLQSEIISDQQYCYELMKKIVTVVKPTPVLIKIGFMSDVHLLRQLLINAAKAGIAGVAGINSISLRVCNNKNQPIFGETRQYSGVSGFPIKNLGVTFIKQIKMINEQEKLNLSIIGMGGITEAKHFSEYHEAGADIAMSATGVMWNPYLGMEYCQQLTGVRPQQNKRSGLE